MHMGKGCGPLVRARKRRRLVHGVREVGNAYRKGIKGRGVSR